MRDAFETEKMKEKVIFDRAPSGRLNAQDEGK